MYEPQISNVTLVGVQCDHRRFVVSGIQMQDEVYLKHCLLWILALFCQLWFLDSELYMFN